MRRTSLSPRALMRLARASSSMAGALGVGGTSLTSSATSSAPEGTPPAIPEPKPVHGTGEPSPSASRAGMAGSRGAPPRGSSAGGSSAIFWSAESRGRDPRASSFLPTLFVRRARRLFQGVGPQGGTKARLEPKWHRRTLQTSMQLHFVQSLWIFACFVSSLGGRCSSPLGPPADSFWDSVGVGVIRSSRSTACILSWVRCSCAHFPLGSRTGRRRPVVGWVGWYKLAPRDLQLSLVYGGPLPHAVGTPFPTLGVRT